MPAPGEYQNQVIAQVVLPTLDFLQAAFELDNPEFSHSANVASLQLTTFPASLQLTTFPPTVTIGPSVQSQTPSHEPQVKAEGDEMAGPTREEFDAKLETAAAETDTKIARIGGKLDTISATLVGEFKVLGERLSGLGEKVSADHEYNRATRWVMIGVIVTSAFAIAGLIVTMAVYGDALFARGMNVRDVVQTVFKEQQELLKREQITPQPQTSPPPGTHQ
jgi:hypothetical protein